MEPRQGQVPLCYIIDLPNDARPWQLLTVDLCFIIGSDRKHLYLLGRAAYITLKIEIAVKIWSRLLDPSEFNLGGKVIDHRFPYSYVLHLRRESGNSNKTRNLILCFI